MIPSCLNQASFSTGGRGGGSGPTQEVADLAGLAGRRPPSGRSGPACGAVGSQEEQAALSIPPGGDPAGTNHSANYKLTHWNSPAAHRLHCLNVRHVFPEDGRRPTAVPADISIPEVLL